MYVSAGVYLLGNFVKTIALFQENGFFMDVRLGGGCQELRQWTTFSSISPASGFDGSSARMTRRKMERNIPTPVQITFSSVRRGKFYNTDMAWPSFLVVLEPGSRDFQVENKICLVTYFSYWLLFCGIFIEIDSQSWLVDNFPTCVRKGEYFCNTITYLMWGEVPGKRGHALQPRDLPFISSEAVERAKV